MNLKKVCFVGLCSLIFTSFAENVWNVGAFEKRRSLKRKIRFKKKG